MKHCETCRVDVTTPAMRCPLCGAPLTGTAQAEKAVYPGYAHRAEYSFVRRLLLFASMFTAGSCIAVNYLTSADVSWWPLVVTALLYVWIALPHAMRRGGNAGGKVLMQVVCAAAAVVLLDWQSGWGKWSLNYVLPVIFCAGIVSIVVLILVNRTNWAGYVLYQFILGLLGLVPLILFFTGIASSGVMVLLPTLLSLASLAGLVTFGDRSIKNEFKRRLRF